MSATIRAMTAVPEFAEENSNLLIDFNNVLLDISKKDFLSFGSFENFLKYVTENAARSLQVERSSVWLYNESQTAIVCFDLFQKMNELHSSGKELKASDYPAYFNFLREERALCASNAHTNPATFEFSASYLTPLNIKSMLDAPIRVSGKVIGVICSEKTDTHRIWSIEEEMFVGVLADYIGRCFETHQRIKAQEENERHRLNSINTAKLASLGEMAGGIAHEINNPLQIILSAAEILKELSNESPVDRKNIANCTDTILKSVHRLRKIVKSFKLLARSDDLTKNVNENFISLDVKTFTEDTIGICGEKFKQNGVTIDVRMPENFYLKLNPVTISQVLINLLNNSFDSIVNSKNPWIRIEGTHTPTEFVFSVTDSGSGIPKEIQEKVLQPFFTTKPIGKGTGLGLSLSKSIIETHGGSFYIDTMSQNTCFVFTLPVKD